ncbi:unnamed protein product, partial [Laminaria digitata]
QGRYGEAETLLRRSLGLREKVLGPGDLDLASSLGDLATILTNQAK